MNSYTDVDVDVDVGEWLYRLAETSTGVFLPFFDSGKICRYGTSL